MARTVGAHTQALRSDNEARRQAWQAMRILRRFTRDEIVMTSPKVKRSNLEKYLQPLIGVDIVRVVSPRVNGRPGSRDVMQLVSDTGPKPPIPWKNGEVFDPNTRLVHYLPDSAHDNDDSPAAGGGVSSS